MLLTTAETPDKIRLAIPEADAKCLAAKVDAGRLVVAREMRTGELAVLMARFLTRGDSVTPPDPRAERATAARDAMREGEIDAGAETYTVDWDIPTIQAVRTHLLYGMMDENVAAGRLASNTPADDPAARLYEELWEAEHALKTSYEQRQGEPYPLPEIDVVIGPETY